MTRNEAQSLISALVCGTHKECSSNHYRDVALGVNKIYNDFEKELEELNNRSCINCKYSFDIFTGIDNNLLNEDFICTTLNVDKVFEKDFYCSKYEAKGE